MSLLAKRRADSLPIEIAPGVAQMPVLGWEFLAGGGVLLHSPPLSQDGRQAGPKVYFVLNAASGRIKIGSTSGDPRARMQRLQVGSDEDLRLIGWIWAQGVTEADLHARFAVRRFRGEWFDGSIFDDVLALIRDQPNAEVRRIREQIRLRRRRP